MKKKVTYTVKCEDYPDLTLNKEYDVLSENEQAYYLEDDRCNREFYLKHCFTEKVTTSIKDSGERTCFETGAVRDMKCGKGRCDLMPLRVVSELLNDSVISCIAVFKETGDTRHLYSALELFGGDHYEGSGENMVLEVSKHFEEGALKYGENNWQKGIPESSYIDSAVRHYLKVLRGDDDEPHDRAFVWNVMCLIWTHDYSKKDLK